ncbi:MAG: TonB-dependent receptor [Saprospiraceae bacterium]|jgi:ferric enterobactin receptor|nr:TonB-dependent receptor [Saprospiraceae bacterium]
MKSALIILLSYFLLFADLLSQPVKHTLPSNTTSLGESLKQLEKKFGVHFAFDPALAAGYQVPADYYGNTLQEILHELLYQTPFEAVLQDKSHYLLVPEPAKKMRIESQGYNDNLISASGRIYDAISSEPLERVTVILLPDYIVSETDSLGKFLVQSKSRFSVHWLEFRYLGYETSRADLKIGSNKNLNVRLNTDLQTLTPITISSAAGIDDIRSLRSTKIYDFQLNRTMAFHDPMRAAQQISGIDATNDVSSALHVRGSQSEENHMRLDELNLYAIDHFYGLFSAINPFLVSEMEVFKSFFPAEYGGKTASYFLMTTPTPSNHWSGKAELSLISTNAFIESPKSDRINFQLAGRITNGTIGKSGFLSNVLESGQGNVQTLERGSQQLISIQPDFSFYDTYSKIKFPIGKKASAHLAGFLSRDHLNSSYNSNYTIMRDSFVEGYEDTTTWKNFSANAGFSYDWSSNQKSSVEANFSEIKQNKAILSTLDIFSTRNNINLSEKTIYQHYMNTRQMQFVHQVSLKVADIKLGAEYNDYRTMLKTHFNLRNVIDDNQIGFSDYAFFVSMQQNIFNQWRIQPGLRYSKYSQATSGKFLPRLNIGYQFTKQFSADFRIGWYEQYLRQNHFEDRFGQVNKFWILPNGIQYPELSSRQMELRLKYQHRRLVATIEAYHKDIDGVIEQIYDGSSFIQNNGNNPPRIPKPLIIDGEAKMYGVDVSLQRKWANYELELSYSYLNAENSFGKVNAGEPYDIPYSRKHQAKAFQLYRLKRASLSLQSVYGSAQPYTDLSLVKDRNRLQIVVNDNTNYLRDYFRVDTELRYEWLFKKSRLEAGVGLFNVLDWNNIKSVQYIYQIPNRNNSNPNNTEIVGNEVKLLGRTLNLSLLVAW